jgi:hypothetical protein
MDKENKTWTQKVQRPKPKLNREKAIKPGSEGWVEFLEAMHMAQMYVENKKARGL